VTRSGTPRWRLWSTTLPRSSPWRVRGIEVRGEVQVLESGGTELGPGFAPEMFQITARRIVSWGLGDGTSASARTVL
jgi:hypothetical protein